MTRAYSCRILESNMALKTKFDETTIGVGDTVKVQQEIVEGEKKRLQSFEGMVIGIKGRDKGESITIRRIGTAQIGIEKIFPVKSPSIKNIEVIKHGYTGTRHAKLYYTRDKSKKEIELIYSRASRKNVTKKEKAKTPSKKTAKSKTTKNSKKAGDKKTAKSTKKTINKGK